MFFSCVFFFFFFSSRRRHTRCSRDWSSDVCSSDLFGAAGAAFIAGLLLGEVAPVATSRRLELLGEKAIRSTSSRYNFVYRADGGWVYAIRALELRTREMTDLMLEREGSGAAYPTIVLAAQRAVYGDSGKLRPR